jgi:hypothetical protein
MKDFIVYSSQKKMEDFFFPRCWHPSPRKPTWQSKKTILGPGVWRSWILRGWFLNVMPLYVLEFGKSRPRKAGKRRWGLVQRQTEKKKRPKHTVSTPLVCINNAVSPFKRHYDKRRAYIYAHQYPPRTRTHAPRSHMHTGPSVITTLICDLRSCVPDSKDSSSPLPSPWTPPSSAPTSVREDSTSSSFSSLSSITPTTSHLLHPSTYFLLYNKR